MDTQQQRVYNNRYDDLYVLNKNPFFSALIPQGVSYQLGYPSVVVANAYAVAGWSLTPDPRYPGWLANFIDGDALLEKWPDEIKADNKELSPYASWVVLGRNGGNMRGYLVPGGVSNAPGGQLVIPQGYFKRLSMSVVWQWIRDNTTLIRPGLKNLQPEWLNRIAHEASQKACGRTLPFRPPYYLSTWPLANNRIEPDNGQVAIKTTLTPTFTGSLFNQTDVATIDPWAKMIQGIEHQVFMYGDGDATPQPVNGAYQWPFGLTMPIAPTVGNIYTHLIQLYLIEIARTLGGLDTPVMNSLDTNVAFAVVWPEASTSAQVAIGNYAVYAGYGLTYGHPEGSYAGKLIKSNGTVDDTEMRTLMRDVAAYANRKRQEWINQNQAIYQKAIQLVQAGANLYALNISQIMDSRIVVTDDGGKVVVVDTVTEVTGGTGQGNVVNQEPKPGEQFDTTNYTPDDTTPMDIGKVQVVSLTQNTVATGSGKVPVVSIARDTSASLVMAKPISQAAKVVEEAKAERSEAVTSEPQKSSLLPWATVAAIAFSLLS